MKIKYVFVSALCIIVAIVVVVIFYPNKKDPFQRTYQEAQSEYDRMLRSVSATRVFPHMLPVQIGSEGKFVGSGTVLLDNQGGPYRIITASHMFYRGYGRKQYFYKVIERDGDGVRGGISEVLCNQIKDPQVPNAEVDIAICSLGNSEPTGGNSSISREWGGNFTKEVLAMTVNERVSVRSVLTGDSFEIVGAMSERGGQTFYVLLRDSRPGESGAGFFDEKRQILYVLNGGFLAVPEVIKTFGLPKTTKSLTLVSPVQLKF